MKTTDFTSNITSDKLNETLFKKFGARINFESYDREELEKYRNLLRTRVHQTESSAKFNDLLSNEAHQKDRHMLELLNTKIKEMLGESKKSNLVKKNKAGPADEPVDQDDDADDKRWDDMDEGAKVDRQAKHITKSMMKSHPGMSKDDAEGAAWAHIKHPKKKKKAEEGIEETNMNKTTEGKKIDQNKDGKNDFKDVQIARLKASGAMKDGKVKESNFPTVADAKARAEKEKTTGKFDKKKNPESGGTIYTRKSSTFSNGTEDKPKEKKVKEGAKPDFLDMDNDGNKKEPMKKAVDDKKKPASNAYTQTSGYPAFKKKKGMKESHYKLHVRLVNESLKYLINEDEEGKAKTITAASDMVNDFTTWMQRVGQYQTKSMIELADSIRAEFGQAESEAFKSAVGPALASTIETLTSQREAISHAVAVLAGEATDVAPMGMAPGMDDGMGDGTGDIPDDAGMDTMNEPTDEFGASDAAAGGAETAGRMTRESRQNVKFRKIAESHSIISRLAR